MKRLVTFYIDENNRKRVQSISAPMLEKDIDLELDSNMYGLIDEQYTDPLPIDGKKIELYYNSDTQMIETEYVDISYEDLTPQEKIDYLKEENANLKAELELTQMALFELDWAINGDDSNNPTDEDTDPSDSEDNSSDENPSNPNDSNDEEDNSGDDSNTDDKDDNSSETDNPEIPSEDSDSDNNDESSDNENNSNDNTNEENKDNSGKDSSDTSDESKTDESKEDNTDVEPEPTELEVELITDLQAALDKAQPGDTIKLTNDINLTDEVSTNKEVTIDLNGFNITSEKNVMYNRSENANVTFTGKGNVRGGSGGSWVCIRASKGIINIEDGTYSVGPDENNEGNSCIYATGSSAIHIHGGEFSTDVAWSGNYYVLNKKDKCDAVLDVTGGKFHNFNPANNASEGADTNFVLDGYEPVIEVHEDDSYVVTIVPTQSSSKDTAETVVETTEE